MKSPEIDGAKIRHIREELELSQSELASKTGLNIRTIQRAEQSEKVSKETLMGIGAALQVNYDEFYISPAPSSVAENIGEVNFPIPSDVTERPAAKPRTAEEMVRSYVSGSRPSHPYGILGGRIGTVKTPNTWNIQSLLPGVDSERVARAMERSLSPVSYDMPSLNRKLAEQWISNWRNHSTFGVFRLKFRSMQLRSIAYALMAWLIYVGILYFLTFNQRYDPPYNLSPIAWFEWITILFLASPLAAYQLKALYDVSLSTTRQTRIFKLMLADARGVMKPYAYSFDGSFSEIAAIHARYTNSQYRSDAVNQACETAESMDWDGNAPFANIVVPISRIGVLERRQTRLDHHWDQLLAWSKLLDQSSRLHIPTVSGGVVALEDVDRFEVGRQSFGSLVGLALSFAMFLAIGSAFSVVGDWVGNRAISGVGMGVFIACALMVLFGVCVAMLAILRKLILGRPLFDEISFRLYAVLNEASGQKNKRIIVDQTSANPIGPPFAEKRVTLERMLETYRKEKTAIDVA